MERNLLICYIWSWLTWKKKQNGRTWQWYLLSKTSEENPRKDDYTVSTMGLWQRKKKGKVANLKYLVIPEAEFHIAAEDTIHGLLQIVTKSKKNNAYFGSS